MVKENVILLHGLMGTSDNHFQPQIETLGENGYNVIPIDLPGHGKNPKDVSLPYFESTLEWCTQNLKDTGESYILGVSMGASLALHSAIEFPDLVKGIVLTGYTPTIPQDMKVIMEKQYDFFMSIKEQEPKIAKEFLEIHGDRWFKTLNAVLDDFTFRYPSVPDSTLRKVKVPTLILNGSNEKYERDAACHMAETNSNITAGLIPFCGHIANLENPELFNQLALDFFKSVSESQELAEQ